MGICIKIENKSNLFKKERGKLNNSHKFNLTEINAINNIINYCICKIKYKNINDNIKEGTGFLCKIPFPNKEQLCPVLITSHHIIDEKDIIEGNKIRFSLDNKKFKIKLDNDRKKYTDDKYNITFIEILV
jgi:hypothetical protein